MALQVFLSSKRIKMKAHTLREYIKKHHDANNAQYARSLGTSRQQIQTWLANQYIVITDNDGLNPELYSPRRIL